MTVTDGIIDKGMPSPIRNPNRNKDYGTWREGRVYSAPLWIGVRTGNRVDSFFLNEREDFIYSFVLRIEKIANFAGKKRLIFTAA